MRLAIAQMLVEGGRVDRNMAQAEVAIDEAAAGRADLVLLPEALDCGWTDPSARTWAEPIPGGAACERLRARASLRGIYVCGGLIERAADLLHNAAVLFSPEGALLLHHRKIHELDIAHDLYAKGDRLAVAETPWGKLGLMICADAFAPQLCISRTLGLLGAKLILSPCAWAVPANHDQARDPYGQLWRDCYSPVAREFELWIAGASNVGPLTAGPWAGRKCIGCSLVIAPGGAATLEGPYGADAQKLLFIDLDLAPTRATGR